MKPNFKKFSDPELNEITNPLQGILTRLSFIDNFLSRAVSGTTDVTPNTQLLVKHGMDPRPTLGIPIIGDVYVHSIDNSYIDVRSTQASMAFELLLVE